MARTPRELAGRWTESRYLLTDVARRLNSCQTLELPGLGFIDGRLDLRGITFPPAGVTAEDCTFANIDFAHTKFSAPFFTGCTFDNCRFDDADLSGLKQWRCNYRACIFRRTNLSNASFGADGGTYSECIFERANFSRGVFIRPGFVRCTFDNCKLKRVDFNVSSFDSCKFIGLMEDVQFRGEYSTPLEKEAFGPAPPNRMANVDFSQACLRMVGFRDHCDLSTVIIPDDGNHLLVKNFPAVLQAAEAEATRINDDRELAFGYKVWLSTYKQLATYQETYIINRLDLAEKEGERFGNHFFAVLEKYNREFLDKPNP